MQGASNSAGTTRSPRLGGRGRRACPAMPADGRPGGKGVTQYCSGDPVHRRRDPRWTGRRPGPGHRWGSRSARPLTWVLPSPSGLHAHTPECRPEGQKVPAAATLWTARFTLASVVAGPLAASFGQPRGRPQQRQRDRDQHGGAGERAGNEVACHPGHAVVVGDHDGHQQQVSPDGGAGHVPGQREPAAPRSRGRARPFRPFAAAEAARLPARRRPAGLPGLLAWHAARRRGLVGPPVGHDAGRSQQGPRPERARGRQQVVDRLHLRTLAGKQGWKGCAVPVDALHGGFA